MGNLYKTTTICSHLATDLFSCVQDRILKASFFGWKAIFPTGTLLALLWLDYGSEHIISLFNTFDRYHGCDLYRVCHLVAATDAQHRAQPEAQLDNEFAHWNLSYGCGSNYWMTSERIARSADSLKLDYGQLFKTLTPSWGIFYVEIVLIQGEDNREAMPAKARDPLFWKRNLVSIIKVEKTEHG